MQEMFETTSVVIQFDIVCQDELEHNLTSDRKNKVLVNSGVRLNFGNDFAKSVNREPGTVSMPISKFNSKTVESARAADSEQHRI